MPRNARNDSTVFLNSTWRFFDVNYMKADCPCRPVNLINLQINCDTNTTENFSF